MIRLYNEDCLEYMSRQNDKCFDFTLTDIPYNEVNRNSNGLRNFDKGKADILTFDLSVFLSEITRLSKSGVCIFCGKEQFSDIYKFFTKQKGTTRAIVWEKTNPCPANGQHIYLSGVEFAVWFKFRGGVFNGFCKNTVFRFPNGKRSVHPTQKNLELFKQLILDNTKEGDTVFDPCAGSFTTGIACRDLNRNCIGVELDTQFYEDALKHFKELQ